MVVSRLSPRPDLGGGRGTSTECVRPAVVILVDEFGPLNLQPRAQGMAFGWQTDPPPAGDLPPLRRVMHMLAVMDLAVGKLCYRIRQRKRWREFLGLLRGHLI